MMEGEEEDNGWWQEQFMKNSRSLAICQKLQTNFKKLKIVERKERKKRRNLFKTTQEFSIKKEEKNINKKKMKQSCNKKEKRTNKSRKTL